MSGPKRPHRVVVLALDPVIAFDLALPAQIFSLVDVATGAPAYEVRTATPTGTPIGSSGGFGVVPHGGLDLLADADTIIVPGTRAAGLRESGQLDRETAVQLRAVAARVRLVALCTGPFVLAAAGLLDGRRAATHWYYAQSFRRLFPNVDLDPDALFVDDGDILTSAGGAAAIDLCLHLVRLDHGSAVANQVARLNVVAALRHGGQRQFIERPVVDDPTASTSAARAHMLEHLDRKHPLSELAAYAHMTVRTFTRRFRLESGMSPAEWLLRARLDHARHLLEATDQSIEHVASAAGFGSGPNLRKNMIATFGVTPSRYRSNYRAAPPAR